MKTINPSKIIQNASLENGAIIAANTDLPYYPKEATSYRYVWVSDASFICVAADILGITDIQEKFFEWCALKPEGFDKTGLLYQKYHTNGRKADFQYQPHHAGLLIWAIYHHFNGKSNRFNPLIEKIAEGIDKIWEYDHFSVETYDIWEERRTFPDLKDNHVLCLASSLSALRRAGEMLETNKWFDTMIEMERVINNTGIVRTTNDKKADASLLGLVYPFNVVNGNDIRMVNVVDKIEKKLVTKGLAKRYEGDVYDGWLWNGKSRFKGAGAWALLSFWLAVYFTKRGDTKKARYYYDSVMERLVGYNFIPEQFGKVELPLNWGTAMYVISKEEIKKEENERYENTRPGYLAMASQRRRGRKRSEKTKCTTTEMSISHE